MINFTQQLKDWRNEFRGLFLTISLFLIISISGILVMNYFYPINQETITEKSSSSTVIEKINILERSPFKEESAFLYRTTGIEYGNIISIIIVVLLGSILIAYLICKLYVQKYIRM